MKHWMTFKEKKSWSDDTIASSSLRLLNRSIRFRFAKMTLNEEQILATDLVFFLVFFLEQCKTWPDKKNKNYENFIIPHATRPNLMKTKIDKHCTDLWREAKSFGRGSQTDLRFISGVDPHETNFLAGRCKEKEFGQKINNLRISKNKLPDAIQKMVVGFDSRLQF